MRTIAEAVEDIKSILNNIERTESYDGETLVDINELADEILTISAYKGKKQTRADRIRSMSDEELADFIEMKQFFALANNGTDGEEYTLKWLQSKVEG